MKCMGFFLRLILLQVFIIAGVAWAEPVQPKVDRLDDMVVTGTRTPHSIKDVPVDTVLINREDIERSNAQTVSDLLKTVPGLSATGVDDVFGSGSSRVRLRGLSFNDGYGLILIDGQRIHGSGQSGAHGEYAVGLNQIPVSMIERIEVVKGPGSVLYGSDAMVGVINIITRKAPTQATIGAGASYGWYDVNERETATGVQVPSDEGSSRNLSTAYVFAGDRPHERFGYLLHYTRESGEGIGQDPVTSQRDSFMGTTDLKLSDRVDFHFKGEVSTYERGGSSSSEEESFRLSAGFSLRPSDNHTLLLRGYRYADNFEARSSASQRDGLIGYDQIEVQHTFRAGSHQVITTGAELQRQRIDYIINNFDRNTRTTVREDVDNWSIYAQNEITLLDRLVIVPGMRYDHHSTFGGSFNPKLSLMYRLMENTNLRGSVGRAFKSPTIRQLYYDEPFWHSPFYIASNPDLDPETSIGYNFSAEQWLFQDRVMINLGFFRNDIKDMVVSETAGELYLGQELRIYRNIEEAMTQGVELLIRLFLFDGFALSAGYAYVDSENRENGTRLTYTPEHQFSISPSYEYQPWGLGAAVHFIHSSKQFTNTANTAQVEAHNIIDTKIYKRIGNLARLAIGIDNLLDSERGDAGNFRSGRILTLRLDVQY